MLPGSPRYDPVTDNGTILRVIMTDTDTNEAERHRAKMAKRKQVQDAEEASKTIEKGLLMVNTGPGSGMAGGSALSSSSRGVPPASRRRCNRSATA
jgi:hypothetical protein